MSLRWKVVFLLSGILTLFIYMELMVLRCAVQPGFEVLERQEATRDIDRCLDAITREQQSLSIFLRTWSAWDDAYQFMNDHNQPFLISNCPPETYVNDNLNLIWFCDNTGKLIWGQTRSDQTGAPLNLSGFTPASLNANSPLIKFSSPLAAAGGFVLTNMGPLLLVSRPVVTSHNHGPIRGALIMGRLFGGDEIQNVIAETHVKMNLWPVTDPALPPAGRVALQSLKGREPLLVDQSNNLMFAYAKIDDIFGRPAVLLRADIPCSITAEGEQAASVACLMSVLGAATILLTLWLLLRVTVIGPLLLITRHAVDLGHSDDLRAHLNLKRRDEIGTLAREFDRMVDNLRQSRVNVVATAHRAGMADMATGVLHNVGNAINAVNISAQALDERWKQSQVAGLSRTADLLRDHRDDLAEFIESDGRGPKLVDYLTELSSAMSREQQRSLADLDRLRQTVQHIRDVIATQQTFAAAPKLTEAEEIAPIVDEVIALHASAAAAKHVAIETQISALPRVPMQKTKFTQVLSNLIRNAIEAAPRRDGRLTIRAAADESAFTLAVSDNGVGIDTADQARIFNYGFTTKPDGHGFGLHFCANAMTEMGGSLRVVSEGKGRGATFTIQLPLQAAQPAGASA